MKTQKPIWTGYYNPRHNACLQVRITRTRDNAVASFEGIIDTGFSGFVQIPLNAATALDLVAPPIGVASTLLANGAYQDVLLKQAPVTINSETLVGVIQIPIGGNCPVLIGMDLLRRFERALVSAGPKIN